jgi:hypothetical protein
MDQRRTHKGENRDIQEGLQEVVVPNLISYVRDTIRQPNLPSEGQQS